MRRGNKPIESGEKSSAASGKKRKSFSPSSTIIESVEKSSLPPDKAEKEEERIWMPRPTKFEEGLKEKYFAEIHNTRGFEVICCPATYLLKRGFVPWSFIEKMPTSIPDQIVEWSVECLSIFNKTHNK
ncbi:OLC1v1006354C1 [Oldenlandia corymbosa var. corymbosa]|uniref:OLC1v1006354C1 n=1 Tax=Oldenlandia corymbosa var. corymbosa TaxID=529605 RepID=A0AAV1DHF1_OLDCO|nr:OLC1v1006354C1 [Oldenlandia corymbosa var. corymbosa]